MPPDPLCLAAAATPIGATVPPLAGGAPKPPVPGADGAVVVVVEAPPGQDVDPVPGAHWADGAVVVVDVAFLPDLGFGHFAAGVEPVEPVAPVGAVVVVDDPDLPLDFLAVAPVVPDVAAAV